MLKPKYVHGVNAEEAPKSLLSRLQNDGQKLWPFDDVVPGDDADDDQVLNWSWTIG